LQARTPGADRFLRGAGDGLNTLVEIVENAAVKAQGAYAALDPLPLLPGEKRGKPANEALRLFDHRIRVDVREAGGIRLGLDNVLAVMALLGHDVARSTLYDARKRAE
jgi:hypothetical protein